METIGLSPKVTVPALVLVGLGVAAIVASQFVDDGAALRDAGIGLLAASGIGAGVGLAAKPGVVVSTFDADATVTPGTDPGGFGPADTRPDRDVEDDLPPEPYPGRSVRRHQRGAGD
jgi:hypothetical protein